MRLYFHSESDSLFWSEDYPSDGLCEDVTDRWGFRSKAIELGLEEPPEFMHQHVYATPETCLCNKDDNRCAVCDWGLAICDACGCAEVELAMDCPRYKVKPTLAQKIAKGEMNYFSGVWFGGNPYHE